MKPIWLIENFTGDNGYDDLIKEIRNQGMQCVVLNITNHFTLQEGIFKPNDLWINPFSFLFSRALSQR